MKNPSFSEAIEKIVERDSRYLPDAYEFVREGLDFTVKLMEKHADDEQRRHVSGQELLEGLRQFALREYGPMARRVLAHWGVTRCEDFGEIVFNMVGAGILGTTERDRKEDFAAIYDFDEAFTRPFRPTPAGRGRAGGSEQIGDPPV